MKLITAAEVLRRELPHDRDDADDALVRGLVADCLPAQLPGRRRREQENPRPQVRKFQ